MQNTPIKNVDYYMNDPEIITEPLPLREIHAIRLMIHDEIKNMGFEERRKYYKKISDKLNKKYNFKL